MTWSAFSTDWTLCSRSTKGEILWSASQLKNAVSPLGTLFFKPSCVMTELEELNDIVDVGHSSSSIFQQALSCSMP